MVFAPTGAKRLAPDFSTTSLLNIKTRLFMFSGSFVPQRGGPYPREGIALIQKKGDMTTERWTSLSAIIPTPLVSGENTNASEQSLCFDRTRMFVSRSCSLFAQLFGWSDLVAKGGAEIIP